jgi:D-arabinose 1-dehydrogenase-like Zn-dependent alcohol dehydrogenase
MTDNSGYVIYALKRAGRLVFVGYTPGLPLPVMPHELVRNELEIVGSRANSKQELAETMELVARGGSSRSWTA